MQIDMRTVVLLSVISCFVCTLFTMQLWRQNRSRFAGMGFWVFNFVLETAGFSLLLLRGIIPDWVSIILTNTLVIAAAILIYVGLERFVNKIGSQIHNYLFFAIYTAVFVYSAIFNPGDFHQRSFFTSVGLFAICFQCLWLLWRRVDPELRPLTFWVGLVFGGYCLVSLIRIAEYCFEIPAGSDYFHSGTFQALILISYQILVILLTYSLILMVNKRLLMEIGSQEEKFAKAFHSAPYAITLTRWPGGTIIDVNESFIVITGYSRAEVVGKSTLDLHLWEDCRERDAGIGSLSATGKIHGMEARFLKKNGEVITGLLSAEIIQVNGEKIIMSSIADISERKRAENELQQHREHLEELVQNRTMELAEARDQAQAASRAKSAFLANMSHELRTPLTAVLGFADLMSRDPGIPGRARENVAIILRSGEHLLALINDILDLSRIEVGRIEVDRRDADILEIVRNVLDMMRERAAAKNLRLVLEPSADFPRVVNTDPDRFRQILVNLVGNAVKFTSIGQVTIQLAAKPVADGHVLAIDVHDTGIGIAREDLERIFQPFEQVMTRMTEGSGLGLAVARQYVQMLGGQISVDSEPGKGTCFHVILPAGRASQAALRPLPPASSPDRIDGRSADVRILIVEDQNENRQLLRRLLEPLNFQLREAVNGEEAIAMFQNWRPHLIFMDRRMPVLDGLTATMRIRALPDGDKPAIIAVSAHSFKEERQEMLAAGCNAFLSKPFSAQDILNLLSEHLHLELVYADGETPPTVSRPLSADDLRDLPAAALATLHRLAVECDDSDIAKWLDTQDCLAPAARAALARLIKDYRFDVIQEITAPLVR